MGYDGVSMQFQNFHVSRMSISRRHIAIVCPGSGEAGSVAAVALHQAAGLQRFFDVTLISDTYPVELDGNIGTYAMAPPAFQWLHRYAHVPREIAFAVYARRALVRLNSSRKLHFVLCHGHVVAWLAAAPIRASLGIRFGLVSHGDIFDRPKGTYDRRLTWLYRRATPVAYRSADLIVSISPRMQELAEKGGAAKSRVRLIPNGIDPRELNLAGDYVPSPPLGDGKPLRLLFVGRLSLEKGIDTLLLACTRLLHRNFGFELRLIGDGPLRSWLEATATELGLSGRSNFVGRLPRAALGSEYLCCHVVCVPSRSDPLPTVVLEAMAAGRPVIGTNIGGIPFAVEHEKTGLLVAPDAPDELADALEQMGRSPYILAQMGRDARQECHKRFNWGRIVKQLAEAIDQTII
jgi:glycosyltransferase involved in cell wall biosynthesis